MEWKIVAFESLRGEKPIEEFLQNLESKAQSKMIQLVDLLASHGPYLGMPYAKKITRNIYELRARGREEVRVFYGFKGQAIYLLHGFRKKTQKTPQKEIDIATKRFSTLT